MRLPSYAIVIILGLLYMVAVGTRLAGGGQPRTPYFKGASAMSYRHALAVADGASLSELDTKANWPEGYRPAAYRTVGVEEFAGWSYRGVRYFSEVDGRTFASRLVVFVFSLCIFTLYALTRRLWDCQAAGLIAAALVALLAPVVDATDGGRFGHTPFVVVLLTAHAVLLLRAHRNRSAAAGIVAAVVAFLAVAAWELGLYYVAAVAAVLVLVPAARDGNRRWVLAAHAVAVLVACASLAYLRDVRAGASWPVALTVSAAAVEFLGGRSGGRVRRGLYLAVATMVLAVILTPLRAGASGGVPVLEYAWYRLRFLFAKPASAGLIPPQIRQLWSFEHAPPGRFQLLQFFLPLAFFAAAAVMTARESLGRYRSAFVAAAVVAAVAAAAYLVDRSALVVSAVAMAPFLAVSGRGVSAALRSRGVLVGIGALLVFVQIAFPLSTLNPVLQIAKSAGFAHRDPNRFLWVSMENTERQLVGFVASRTSVKDAFLGAPEVTSLLLTFAGRTSVPLAGAIKDAQARRNVELAHLVYEDETSLFEACRRLGVQYVLYSIDVLLDTTRYSPAYLAGVPNVSRDSAAFRMHFAPESLRHFTLVYENVHYRLFRVSETPGTLFITDHPPVYQIDAFERAGGNVEAFRQRTIELLLAYREALKARAMGNTQGALRSLTWCLEQAPGFTLARIAVGTTLIQAERLEEARDVLLSVIGYAPDNEAALYHTAYALAALEETDRAREYLNVFFGIATDPDLVEKARLLKTFLDQGIPVTPRAIPE